jgi:hypothetical protein
MASLIGVSVKPAAGGGYTCRVPLDVLSEDGVPPEQGDNVSYQVDGTVQSVDEENATIKIDAVNGQPITDESASDEAAEDSGGGPPGESTADMGARLKGAAAQSGSSMF